MGTMIEYQLGTSFTVINQNVGKNDKNEKDGKEDISNLGFHFMDMNVKALHEIDEDDKNEKEDRNLGFHFTDTNVKALHEDAGNIEKKEYKVSKEDILDKLIDLGKKQQNKRLLKPKQKDPFLVASNAQNGTNFNTDKKPTTSYGKTLKLIDDLKDYLKFS